MGFGALSTLSPREFLRFLTVIAVGSFPLFIISSSSPSKNLLRWLTVRVPFSLFTAIAATSQLAHIVSNAYIKSPTLRHQAGFSAGSYQDLTRVAKLSEEMWTSLFLLNREALLFEVETIIGHLSQYRDALAAGNAPELKELLREGRILKEEDVERTAVRNQK